MIKNWGAFLTVFVMILALAGAGASVQNNPPQARPDGPVFEFEGIPLEGGLYVNDEAVERGAPNARHFRQPDGSYAAFISAGARWFHDPATGGWQPIDTALHPAPGGGFVNTRNVFETHIPAMSGEPLALVLEDGSLASYGHFAAIENLPGSLAASAASASAKGSRAAFAGLFPGAEEEFLVQAGALKHNLVFNSQPAFVPGSGAPYLRSALTLPEGAQVFVGGRAASGEAVLEDGGTLEVRRGGRFLFSIPQPVVYEKDYPWNSMPLRLTLAPLGGTSYEMRLEFPHLWMSVPGRNYPVVIDPQLVAQPPAADTYINQTAANTGTNYGTCDLLRVGDNAVKSTAHRSLLLFDLSTIPVNYVVSKAQMELYATATTDTKGSTHEAYRLTRSWTEGAGDCTGTAGGGATWATYNGTNAWTAAGGDFDSKTLLGSVATGTGVNAWKTFASSANFISAVQGWVDTPANNFGLLVQSKGDGGATTALWSYASRENATTANRPILRVDYDTCASVLSCGVITASKGTSICQGSSQDYTVAWSNGTANFTIEWDFNYDGKTFVPNGAFTQTGATKSPSAKATYGHPTAGAITVAARVTDSCKAAPQSCISTLAVTVNSTPSASITADGPTTFCDGGSVGLTAVATGGTGPFSYAWAPTGETTSSIVATTSGNYNVTITDTNGCKSAKSANTVVTVNPLPVPVISGPAVFCAGQTITLDAGAVYSAYQWILDGGDIGGANAKTYGASAAGDYQVRVTDANGCVGTSAVHTVTESLTPPPTPAITGPTTVCKGSSIVLDAGAGYSSYLWSPGGATSQTINPSPAVDTTYTVTVTDGAGCTGMDTHDVTVLALPTPAITGNSAFCTGGSTTLDAGAGYASYQWILNSGDIGGANSQTYNASAVGDYQVRVTDGNGCIGTSAVFPVSENSPLTPSFTHDAPKCENGLVTFNGSYTGGEAGKSSLVYSGGTNISDNKSNGFIIPSSVSGLLTSVSTTVNMNPPVHAGGTDTLLVALVSPAGTSKTLYSGLRSGWSNGTFGPYDDFDGENALGNWTLNVTHTAPDNTAPNGSLTGWTLDLDYLGGGSVVFNWDFDDSDGIQVDATGQSVTHSYTSAKTYTVTLSTVNGACVDSASKSDVVIETAPAVTITGPASMCMGDPPVTLDAGAGYASYLWTPGGATTQTIDVAPQFSTTYQVDVTTATGCKASGTHMLTVVPVPGSAFTHDGPKCIGQDVNFTAADTTGPTGTHNLVYVPGATQINDGTKGTVFQIPVFDLSTVTSVSTSVAMTPPTHPDNTDTLNLSLRHPDGTSKTLYSGLRTGWADGSFGPYADFNGKVLQGNWQLVVAHTETDNKGTKGALTSWSLSIAYTGGPTLTYSWDFDDSDGIQVDSTSATPSRAYGTGGSYTVTLTVSNGTCQSTTTNTVDINAITPPSGSVPAGSVSGLPTDMNSDGCVDELIDFSFAFGSFCGDSWNNPDADFNADGAVDGDDLDALISDFGLGCFGFLAYPVAGRRRKKGKRAMTALAAALAALGILALAACGGGGGRGPGGVSYSIDYNNPASTGGDVTLEADSFTSGGDGSFDLVLNGVANVWGVQFTINYDPEVFEFVSASKMGSDLAGGACNEACLLLAATEGDGATLVSITRAGNPATVGGVTVDGMVVRLFFKAVGKGSIDFSFSGNVVKDPDNNPIDVGPWKVDGAASID